MTGDVILDVTADFIRSSQSNLKLALQAERAMPCVRKHFVKATLDTVEERFPRTEWTIDRSGVQDVMAKGASLALRHEGWTTNHGDAAIWLGTNSEGWTDVWIGLYFFAGRSSHETLSIEQTAARLAARGFSFDDTEDEPGVWKGDYKQSLTFPANPPVWLATAKENQIDQESAGKSPQKRHQHHRTQRHVPGREDGYQVV